MALLGDVDLEALSLATEYFTGAELEAVCREAALAALRQDLEANGVAQVYNVLA
jgi:SpoVK/Ycf46/Vps4 family AAA+-type ATPase